MFWLVAALLTLMIAAPLALALLRAGDVSSAAQKDMALYRDQLAEVERDVARGTLGQVEAETARTEVARRLLAADRRAQVETAGGPAGRGARLAGIGLVALALAGGVGLYTRIGAPGYSDVPLADRLAAVQKARETRPRQAQAEAAAPLVEREKDPKFEALVEQLRQAVAGKPEDPQGLRLLADNEARLGNFVAAREAQERLLTVLGDQVGPAEWTDYAELMILAAGGYVSPEAETALTRAIRQDPRNPRARYYSGLAMAQTGRPDIAYRMWSGLLQDSGPNDPWVPLIQGQILRVAQEAGIPPNDPGLRGPTAEQVEDAADLTPEERQDMIRGMVAGLADRLATEGGPPAEWARLIRAYGVLGETAKASDIWNEAQQVFAGNDGAMALLLEAARAAEVAQ